MDFNFFPDDYFLVFFPLDYFGDPVGIGLTEIVTGLFGKLSSTVDLDDGGCLKPITTGLFTEKILV